MVDIPQTPNFKLFKPPFDRKAWHRYINDNFSIIDAVLTTYLEVGNIVGVWQNSTAYLDGQRVIDPDVGQVFECNANHTSAAGPTTFAEDRLANPTFWTSLAVTARGLDAWTPGTLYQPNDFVVSGTIYAVCIATHTSTAVFADDAVYWDYLIDISTLPTLPSITGQALNLLRVNAGETAAEWVSSANVISWLGLGSAAFLAAATFAAASHVHAVADLSDASANGKSLISAANYAAMRTLLGLGGDALLNTGGVECWAIQCTPDTGAPVAANNVRRFRAPYAFTISDVRASLATAQTSGTVITIDINEGGTTILSTKLTIDNTEKTSTTAATARVISDTAIANDAEISIDVDAIGDGTARGLVVYIIGVKA